MFKCCQTDYSANLISNCCSVTKSTIFLRRTIRQFCNVAKHTINLIVNCFNVGKSSIFLKLPISIVLQRCQTEAITTERQKKKFEDKTQQNRQSDLIEASPEETQRRIVLSTLLRKNYLLMNKVFWARESGGRNSIEPRPNKPGYLSYFTNRKIGNIVKSECLMQLKYFQCYDISGYTKSRYQLAYFK